MRRAPFRSCLHRAVPLPAAHRGFSLLEMLVAVALFAVASALAWGGLRALVQAQEQSTQVTARLGRLQFAVGLIERDVITAARRGVRDAYGGMRPAFEGSTQRMELTRYGHANPLALPRSELERVAWIRRDGDLLRQRWAVLDRAAGTQPIEDSLLDGVDSLELVFLDDRGREHRQWPPSGGTSGVLPRGLRLRLEVEGFGEIERVLELPMEPAP